MINILQPQVYNLIAAGEVVERPASVVKELVENCIDAGAKKIDISIENGGITSIRISDDGAGMSREDLSRCILPHATSKICSAKDLESISSLGFRGEALASIAAVSTMHITSCNGEDSYKLSAKFGAITDMTPCGRARGTTCEVLGLFENTPARLKFLKKPKQEQAEITSAVISLIFSRPDISFTYSADGESIFKSGGDLYEAIYAVYGKEIADQLIYHERETDGFVIKSYLGKPGFSKHNRNYQTAIINGRVVANSTISIAASQAYGGLLMKRCYPVYVIFIKMPESDIDVNVHPNKKEVRFKDVNRVFSAVYRFFESALTLEKTHLDLSAENEEKNGDNYKNTDNLDVFGNNSSKYSVSDTKLDSQKSSMSNKAETKVGAETGADAVEEMSAAQRIREKFSKTQEVGVEKKTLGVAASTLNVRSIFDAQRHAAVQPTARGRDIFNSTQTLLDIAGGQLEEDYTVVGQILKTYLIVERNGKVYLIDQHAVHEKFIYENYVEQLKKAAVTSQQLLIPYVFNATAAQYDCMIKLIEPLKAIGFDICEFGGLTFKISAIPFVLQGLDLEAFFNDIAGDNKLISANLDDIHKEKLMQRACKRAIKSGDVLSNVQIRKLFASMDKGLPLQCPHGRPAVIAFSRADLDKLFKRIV